MKQDIYFALINLLQVNLMVALAAMCNSVMDTLATPEYYIKSIFSTFSNQQYWSFNMSQKNKWVNGVIGGQLKTWKFLFIKSSLGIQQTSDGWHLMKMLMIVFICLAIAFKMTCFSLINPYVDILINFCVSGIVWDNIFSLFFNHLNKK